MQGRDGANSNPEFLIGGYTVLICVMFSAFLVRFPLLFDFFFWHNFPIENRYFFFFFCCFLAGAFTLPLP